MKFSVSVSDERGAEMAAYAEAKGFRSVGALASRAIEMLISRDRPTKRQQAMIDKSIGQVMRGRFAVLHASGEAIQRGAEG